MTLARLAMTVTVGAAYTWPLDEPAAPTSTFGEYRSRHFHGGLDLSTHETIGLPVRAPDDGVAVRVRASGAGYGRALYFLMKDGRTAVFGHLDGFAPAMQAWMDSVQHATERYEQDLEAPPGRFRYARGDTVAFTGASGAGPPHLHVELREGDTGLNPMHAGLPLTDGRAPVITALWLYPAGVAGRVEGGTRPRRYAFRQGAGGPRLERPVTVRGPVRAAVEAYDLTEARSNHLGVYAVSASLDGKSVYEAVFDSVSWLAATDAEVVFDPRARAAGHELAHALTPPAGLPCLALRRSSVAWRLENGAHELVMEARDVAGNRTEARATLVWSDSMEAEKPRRGRAGVELELLADGIAVRPSGAASASVRPPLPAAGSAGEERVFGLDSSFLGRVEALAVSGADTVSRRYVVGEAEPGWSQTLRSDDGNFLVRFEGGSAFERQTVSLESLGGGFYRVEPGWLPIRDGVEVRLRRPEWMPTRGAGLFSTDGGGWRFVGGADSAESGVLTGRVRNLGTFAVRSDTLEPRVGTPRVYAPKRGATPAARRPPVEVRWSVGDAGSGLDASGFRLEVDGRVEPAEYDPEASRLGWRPGRAAPGEHVYRLTVTDRLGNAARREGRFRLP